MNEALQTYQKLNKLFNDNGYSLYLVGGTVRDYLFDIELTDMDAVTDATPSQMKKFLKEANYTFERFGSVSIKVDGLKFDITTMREEDEYLDSRHPGEIKFIKDLSVDVKRRDFTINALYLDKDLKVIDYVGGNKDAEKRILRMVGNPQNRLKEDPMRIIRALRFSIDFNLTIDSELDIAIKDNISLIEKLNIDKVRQDIKKIKSNDKALIMQKFEDYNIKHLLDVIE